MRFRATLYSNLPIGTRVTNTGTVYWNDPVQTASASVSIDVGGIPGVGLVNGRVWHDADFDRVYDANEIALADWDVELYLQRLAGARRAHGARRRLPHERRHAELRDDGHLRAALPPAGRRRARRRCSAVRIRSSRTSLQRITEIIVLSGSNLQNLNLPIDPNGIVYDAISRAPIAGATVSLVAPGSGTALPSSCFYDANQQGQVTLGDGYYKFDLSFGDPACPTRRRVSARGDAAVDRLPRASLGDHPAAVVGDDGRFRRAVVPGLDRRRRAGDDAALRGDAVGVAAAAVRRAGHRRARQYHLHLLFDDSAVPGSSQIFNNHIPLDLDLDESISVTKTTPLVHVSRGQLVPYIITLTNGIGVNLPDVTVVDRFPAGFRYVEGSARLDGVLREPTLAGRELSWSGLTITPDGRHELKLLLAVGAGVGEGEFVNRAQAMSALTGGAVSAEASATRAHRSGSRARLHRRHRQGVRRRRTATACRTRASAASPACASRRRAACSRRPINSAASTSPARSRRTRAAAATSC